MADNQPIPSGVTFYIRIGNANFHTSSAAYATDVLLAQRAFYGQKFGWAFEIFMCM